jgi:hypothetical protein
MSDNATNVAPRTDDLTKQPGRRGLIGAARFYVICVV